MLRRPLLDSEIRALFYSLREHNSSCDKPRPLKSLDCEGFFASVMPQAMPTLRGHPVGVIAFETSATHSTVVIACSKEAKAAGCNNGLHHRHEPRAA